MAYLAIIIAFLIGYYLGSRPDIKKDIAAIKEKLKPSRIIFIKKAEPLNKEIKEILKADKVLESQRDDESINPLL